MIENLCSLCRTTSAAKLMHHLDTIETTSRVKLMHNLDTIETTSGDKLMHHLDTIEMFKIVGTTSGAIYIIFDHCVSMIRNKDICIYSCIYLWGANPTK